MDEMIERFSRGCFVCDVVMLADICGYVVYVPYGDVKYLVKFGLAQALEAAEKEALACMWHYDGDLPEV